jgi:hypothetical protein
VTCLLKARIEELEKTSIARQRLCKHVSIATNHVTTATDTHSMIDELLEVVFCIGSMQKLYKDNQLGL